MVDTARTHKDAIYEQLARVGKATSAPRRLELLDLLAQAPRTVESLADLTAMSVANTSQHLQVLLATGLVERTRDGLHVTYRLSSEHVLELCLRLRSVAEKHVAELARVKERFFADSDIRKLSAKELLEGVRRGRLILIDVRPVEEYAAAHIPGARSIPHDELKRRLAKLPKGRAIVAYCRGPYCVYAIEAVKLLRARGFQASRMDAGVPEWRASGLPVEMSQPEGA